ncbi:uncharacterized protein LY89DRAFT_676515 [Mollisia scopiformis]|uniref:Uncharacterized protein n=1 Tax=Mollisia scopiformis TaxID=149040 RepID=A0A132BA77_MOLSC|nr:uncharacterized protein LY89DRAFT_676515 [Mollisia scopiformis]KUJ09153.1 hypothetical protein LY89DRAFT_676515 [Mollisia scopiformis]
MRSSVQIRYCLLKAGVYCMIAELQMRQVGNLPPASSQASASTPTTTPIDTPVDAPTSTPAVVPQTTPDLPPSAAPTPAISSIVSDVPAPSPVQTTAQAQAPASLTPSAETSPTDAPIPASTTSLPDNTPPPAQASSSISIPAAFTPAPQESAISSSITAFSIYESEAIPASPTSTQASTAQASSIAESNSNEQSTTSPTSTNKHLAPLAIAGITILVLGFVATIVSLASIQLRRRKRKSYIASQRLEEKLRPMTEDGPSPPNSSGRGLPWDSRRQNKASAVMGIEVGPRQPESEERPKSRGKGAGESGNNVPPSSFPMLGIGTGAPQGVNTQSPPGSGNSIKRTGTGGGAGAQQPLKSAMKKPRDRPKSRPLIIADGKEMNFGFNPLGSNPRSPT